MIDADYVNVRPIANHALCFFLAGNLLNEEDIAHRVVHIRAGQDPAQGRSQGHSQGHLVARGGTLKQIQTSTFARYPDIAEALSSVHFHHTEFEFNELFWSSVTWIQSSKRTRERSPSGELCMLVEYPAVMPHLTFARDTPPSELYRRPPCTSERQGVYFCPP